MPFRNTQAAANPAAALKIVYEVILILFSAGMVAAGLRLFLIPHQLLSGGIAGVASIIGYLTGWKISFIYFALNIPLLVWGWRVVGKRYIVLSLISVISTTWFMELIPEVQVTTDSILAGVFGGILTAVGIGVSLRAGGSTGGFDIIGSIVTRKRDVPMGTVLFVLNGIVILMLGFFRSWSLALYSMLSTYIKGRVVDMIHIRHIKVTCFIITRNKDRMLEALLKFPHGATVMNTEGGYTHQDNTMIMTVTTRYEFAELRRVIREIDPNVFVNVVETVDVIGKFRRLE